MVIYTGEWEPDGAWVRGYLEFYDHLSGFKMFLKCISDMKLIRQYIYYLIMLMCSV